MLGSSDGGSSRCPGWWGTGRLVVHQGGGLALVDRPAMEVNVPLRVEELLFVLELVEAIHETVCDICIASIGKRS